MKQSIWQWVFLTGAVFNVIVAGAFAIFPTTTLALLGFTEGMPANPIWYALFWWLVAVFGIGYYMVSRDPAGNRGIAMMGFIGKAGVWVVATVLWFAGDVPVLFLLIACADLLYSLLFLWFLAGTGRTAASADFAH